MQRGVHYDKSSVLLLFSELCCVRYLCWSCWEPLLSIVHCSLSFCRLAMYLWSCCTWQLAGIRCLYALFIHRCPALCDPQVHRVGRTARAVVLVISGHYWPSKQLADICLCAASCLQGWSYRTCWPCWLVAVIHHPIRCRTGGSYRGTHRWVLKPRTGNLKIVWAFWEHVWRETELGLKGVGSALTFASFTATAFHDPV